MMNLFKSVINRGGFDLPLMLQRIDEYHITGRLTDAEHDELIAAARGEATPDLNPTDEIQRLWAAIHDLTARVTELEGGTVKDDVEIGDGEDDGETDPIPEYVQPTGAHDAYYAGSLVSYNGTVYECTAPAGVACVWTPDQMPDFWAVVE